MEHNINIITLNIITLTASIIITFILLFIKVMAHP